MTDKSTAAIARIITKKNTAVIARIIKKKKSAAITRIGPDLKVAPHILAELMELFAGDSQKAAVQLEYLVEHLAICHYCRVAVITLLRMVQENEHANKESEEFSRKLLKQFVAISLKIDTREAREFERRGAYAEAIVAYGQDEANQRFPDVVAHLRNCHDCRFAVDETVNFLTSDKFD